MTPSDPIRYIPSYHIIWNNRESRVHTYTHTQATSARACVRTCVHEGCVDDDDDRGTV